MKAWFEKYRHLLLLPLLFGTVSFLYFLTSHGDAAVLVHVPLDDKIPFIPAFILPYVLWYAYVPLLMLAVGVQDKRAFYRQCVTLFSGVVLSILVFIFFPSAIDFRPTAEGDGLWLWICRIVFANDLPRNVCPSLHCFEAVIVHLTAFHHPSLHKRYGWRALSVITAALICASTVFVKQHSIVDVVCGVLLAFAVYALNYGVLWREKRAH